jgi:hypothetical protein
MFNRQNLGTDYCAYSDPLYQLFPVPDPKFNPGPWFLHQTAFVTNDFTRDLRGNIKGRVVWGDKAIASRLKDINNKMIVIYDKIYDISGFFTAQTEKSSKWL